MSISIAGLIILHQLFTLREYNMRTTTASPGGADAATTARDAGADTTTRRVKGTRRKTIEKAQRPKKKKTQKLPETWTASLAAFLVRNQISRLPLTPGGVGSPASPGSWDFPVALGRDANFRLPMASLASGVLEGFADIFGYGGPRGRAEESWDAPQRPRDL